MPREFQTLIKDGYEYYLCEHDLEECDICQLSMTLLNQINRLNHEKIVGKVEKKQAKEVLKTKGCSNPICEKKSEDIAKLRYCASCMTVAYCSVECQRDHWNDHKIPCKNAVYPVSTRLEYLHNGNESSIICKVIKSSTNDGPYLLQDIGVGTTLNIRADLVGPSLDWQDHSGKIHAPDRSLKWRILQGIELQGFQTGIPDPRERMIISLFPYGKGLYHSGNLVQEYEANLPTGKFFRIIGLNELMGKGKGGRDKSAYDKYDTPASLGFFDEDEDGKYICLEKDMLKNFEYILQPCPPRCMFVNTPYELPMKVVHNKKKWKRRSD